MRVRRGMWAILPVSLALLVLVAITIAILFDQGQTSRTRHLQLPPLTGPAQVGTISLVLVDPSRGDPLAPSGRRELMIQVWYPARDVAEFPLAPYMPATTARLFEQSAQLPSGTIANTNTRAHLGAPIAAGRRAVVLYSPGLGDLRFDATALVENLASLGYIVITIDHTLEAPFVEFPDGRIERAPIPFSGPGSAQNGVTPPVLDRRVADVRLVLDRLPQIDAGGRFAGHLDLRHVGMFGFSLGGATAAETMLFDSRISAGVDLDGAPQGPVATAGLKRPFLVMLAPKDLTLIPSMARFVRSLLGPHLVLQLAASGHVTFSDLVWMKSQLATIVPTLARTIPSGSIPASEAVDAESAYLAAFFDTYLRGHSSPLLQGPHRALPAVSFLTSPHRDTTALGRTVRAICSPGSPRLPWSNWCRLSARLGSDKPWTRRRTTGGSDPT